MRVHVEGFAQPRFAEVRAEFERNFTRRGEVGAAFCVYQHGQVVVDLWGGTGDHARGEPWQADTMALLYSGTKGLTAGMALMLVADGKLQLDAPVVEYWPEFAASGKRGITVREVLTHRAGLPALGAPITMTMMERWSPITEAFARRGPWWEPGTQHGYHVVSFGWLVGELIRRVTGKTPGAYLRSEVADELDLDLWIGLPSAQEQRVSPMIPPREFETYDDPGYAEFAAELLALGNTSNPERAMRAQELYSRWVRGRWRDIGDRLTAKWLERRVRTLTQRAFAEVIVSHADMNSSRLHALEMPGGNGIGTARSLARYYAALAGQLRDVRPIGRSLLEEAARPWSVGPDRILRSRTAFGLGFMVPGGLYFDGWGSRTFGHVGAGGAIGFADLENGLAMGYILNRHTAHPRNPRSDALIRRVYSCIR